VVPVFPAEVGLTEVVAVIQSGSAMRLVVPALSVYTSNSMGALRDLVTSLRRHARQPHLNRRTEKTLTASKLLLLRVAIMCSAPQGATTYLMSTILAVANFAALHFSFGRIGGVAPCCF